MIPYPRQERGCVKGEEVKFWGDTVGHDYQPSQSKPTKSDLQPRNAADFQKIRRKKSRWTSERPKDLEYVQNKREEESRSVSA